MTTLKIQVFLPGDKTPVDLDYYFDYLTAVAACGTYTESFSLSDDIRYDNPTTGNRGSIRCN